MPSVATGGSLGPDETLFKTVSPYSLFLKVSILNLSFLFVSIR
ncbi:unnamed protein product [Acanthoscelides obtectus]|uniref:Uncharacterized protein n=1 Tax=Acanthoscelides obtectus TaxID=200917 RepID=A0A9P0VN49_ACAOB|nr:unnamed protein product [Acanthoscelides obtectus]CAK1626861.1 hypothetical protein AOBTE_LOCUS4121 [Acanthoscelides obtectus]